MKTILILCSLLSSFASLRSPLRGSLWLAVSLCSAVIPHPSFAAEQRPNIVLINADDLGWKDTGYAGSDFYETPHLDALARSSMNFTQAYAGASLCTPSRACLMSGQTTPRHGNYAVKSTANGPETLMRLVPVPNAAELSGDKVTLAEMLKTVGYATGCFGKWHIGQGKHTGAGAQGFDVVTNVFMETKTSGVAVDPKDVVATTKNACDFITAQKKKPFFAYIAYHAIHSPHQSTQASLDHFKAKAHGKQHTSATYAACVTALDDAVGQVMKHLAESGLDKSTLVIFTSDNGATSESPQTPLRSGKAGYYEGGLRIPLLVRWPGKVTAGSHSDVPVTQLDLYPTFMEITKAAAPKSQPLDGHSLLPLLEGRSGFAEHSLHWHYPGYWDGACPEDRDKIFRAKPVSVVRRGDWKLMLFHEEWQIDGGRARLAQNNAVELYNLRDDLSERRNLAAKESSKRDALLDELLAWLKETQAPMPTEANSAYDPNKRFKSKKKKFSDE